MSKNLANAVEKVVAHFSREGAQYGLGTLDDGPMSSRCVYRNSKGASCAIGCLISDETATNLKNLFVFNGFCGGTMQYEIWSLAKSIDGMRNESCWNEYLLTLVLGIGCSSRDVDGLAALQRIHDYLCVRRPVEVFVTLMQLALDNKAAEGLDGDLKENLETLREAIHN